MEERRERRELRHPRGNGFEMSSVQKVTAAAEEGRGAKRDQEEAAAAAPNVETKKRKTC